MILWMEKHNTDPNIKYLFEVALLYLSSQKNNIPTWKYQSLHSDILQAGCPSILLELLPVIKINTQQSYYSDIRSRRTVSNWWQLIIQKLWKLLQEQWTQRIWIKHDGEALDDITKSNLLYAEITAENLQGEEQLPPRYKSYFESNLDSLLETSLTCRKNWYRLIKTERETTQSGLYTIFSSSKPLISWIIIQSTPYTNTNGNNTLSIPFSYY